LVISYERVNYAAEKGDFTCTFNNSKQMLLVFGTIFYNFLTILYIFLYDIQKTISTNCNRTLTFHMPVSLYNNYKKHTRL
jgi:hypothetical protein